MIVLKKCSFLIITAIITIVPSLVCMEKYSASFPKATLQFLHKQRCAADHKHPSIMMRSADETFSYPICATKAALSKHLKTTYDLTSTTHQKYSYTFDDNISPIVAFLITAYLQCASTEHQEIIEKTIIQNPTLTQTFDLFADVLYTAQLLNIKPLNNALNNYIFTTLLKESQHNDLQQELPNFYHTLLTYNPFCPETSFTIQEQSTIKNLIISPDKKYIVTTHLSDNKQYLNITIYDYTNPSEVLAILPIDVEQNPESTTLEFSPDGSLLAIKSYYKLSLYDCTHFKKGNKNLKSIASLETDYHTHILVFSFSHDSKKILVTYSDGFGFLYDCITLNTLGKFDFNRQQVLDKPLFTYDDAHVIVALDCEYALFSCYDQKKIVSRRTTFPINALHLSPDGKELIVLAEPVCLFVTTEGLQFQSNVKTDLFTLTKLGFSHDSIYSAVTSNATCYIYKRGENKPEQKYTCKHDIIHLAFSPTQPYLMLFDKRTCTLYNYATQKCVKSIPIDCIDGAQAIFSPDGRYLVITCNKTGKIYFTYPLEEVFDKITGSHEATQTEII